MKKLLDLDATLIERTSSLGDGLMSAYTMIGKCLVTRNTP